MRKYRFIVLGVALAMMAGACQSGSPPLAQEAPPQSDQQPPTEVSEPVKEAEAPTSEAIAPVEIEPAAPVEVRQGLAATDPATVNFANGSPTLVEFFAFW